MNDATLHQQYFLSLMAVEDINYENSIENKLVGIAKGLGVSFESNSSRRQSNNFREKMKQKQKERKNSQAEVKQDNV